MCVNVKITLQEHQLGQQQHGQQQQQQQTDVKYNSELVWREVQKMESLEKNSLETTESFLVHRWFILILIERCWKWNNLVDEAKKKIIFNEGSSMEVSSNYNQLSFNFSGLFSFSLF